MKGSVKEEMENFKACVRNYGSRTAHYLLSAFLIWLFGVLVFIPLASSLNWQTTVFCTLIFFIAFTALVLRALPGLKILIDAFSTLSAKRYSLKKGLSHENSVTLFRHLSYIISSTVLYLLYFPFLTNFHPSINGAILILVLVWVFFLALGLFPILSQKMLEWLTSEE